jgi:hypothetical protein
VERELTGGRPVSDGLLEGMATPPHLADLELTTAGPEDFDATYDAALRAFQEEAPGEAREFDRQVLAGERLFGFTTGGRWVSTFGALGRAVTVPGGAALPVAAVTVVTVLASFRRRGLLTAMMRDHLQDTARRGEPLSALWASESGIYGRFGYGQAAPGRGCPAAPGRWRSGRTSSRRTARSTRSSGTSSSRWRRPSTTR